jgi:hypothetical protein
MSEGVHGPDAVPGIMQSACTRFNAGNPRYRGGRLSRRSRHTECMSRYDTRYTQSYENQSPCGSGQRHRGVLTSLVVLRCARRRHCETSSGVQRRNAMQCESVRRTTYRRLQPCAVSDDDCGSIHVEAVMPTLSLRDSNGLPRPIECGFSESTVGL